MQQYADIYLLLNDSTCFGRPSRPSSGVHKTVVAASGTDHTVWGAFVKIKLLKEWIDKIFPGDKTRELWYLLRYYTGMIWYSYKGGSSV